MFNSGQYRKNEIKILNIDRDNVINPKSLL
jgi:hypothetical protein